MINYARVIKDVFNKDIAGTPKVGAAGGLAAAFLILDCKLVKGIDLVLEHTQFEKK
jgi:glycerate kinase